KVRLALVSCVYRRHKTVLILRFIKFGVAASGQCGGWVNRTRIVVYIILGALGAGSIYAWRSRSEQQSFNTIQTVAEQNAEAQAAWDNRDQTVDAVVSNGQTWSDMLQDMDFDQQTVFNATEAARRVYNLRSIRPGNKYSVTRSHKGELQLASYRID